MKRDCDSCVAKIFPSPIIIKNQAPNHNPVICIFDYSDLGDFLFLQAIGFQDENLLFQKSDCILKTPQVTWRTIYCFLWNTFRLLPPDILLTEQRLYNDSYSKLFTDFEVTYYHIDKIDLNSIYRRS